MKQEIEQRFEANLARVRSLVALYQAQAPGQSGRRSVAVTDLLRASVVLAHATLEDLIRSVLEWKLPTAKPESFKELTLAGEGSVKFSLIELAKHRGKAVDQVIVESIRQWLAYSNFNDTDQIAGALIRCGLTPQQLLGQYGADLDAMMKRRHWIVHRVDRNESAGSGHYVALRLDLPSVEQWLAAAESFGKQVLAQC